MLLGHPPLFNPDNLTASVDRATVLEELNGAFKGKALQKIPNPYYTSGDVKRPASITSRCVPPLKDFLAEVLPLPQQTVR